MFNGICEAMHRELDEMDEKYSNGEQLNKQDLETIDTIAHALKSIATYEAMKGASEYSGYDGGSYARGRSRTTGRYMSRNEGSSYDQVYHNPGVERGRY